MWDIITNVFSKFHNGLASPILHLGLLQGVLVPERLQDKPSAPAMMTLFRKGYFFEVVLIIGCYNDLQL